MLGEMMMDDEVQFDNQDESGEGESDIYQVEFGWFWHQIQAEPMLKSGCGFSGWVR